MTKNTKTLFTIFAATAVAIGISTLNSHAEKMQYVNYREPRMNPTIETFASEAAYNYGIKNHNKFNKVNLITVYNQKYKTIKNTNNEGTLMIYASKEAKKIINNKKYGDKDLPNFFGVKLSDNPTIDEMMELPIKLEMVEEWWKYQHNDQCKNGVIMRIWIGDTYLGRIKIKRKLNNLRTSDFTIDIISVANKEKFDIEKHKNVVWTLLNRRTIYNLNDNDFALHKSKHFRNIIQMNYNSFNGGICLNGAFIADRAIDKQSNSIVYGSYTPSSANALNYNDIYYLIKLYPTKVKKHLSKDFDYDKNRYSSEKANVISDVMKSAYKGNTREINKLISKIVRYGEDIDYDEYTEEEVKIIKDIQYLNNNISEYIESAMKLKDYKLQSGKYVVPVFNSHFQIVLITERYNLNK